MKLFYALIICFLYILSASSVFAEYYHYIDKDGIKYYTDDISEVPEDQRPDLSVYQSIQTSPEEKPPEEKDIETKDTIMLKSIEIKKGEIDNEYEALVKKRQALTKQKKTIGEKKYNELATQFNIEIKQYQEKKEAYEKLVEQYNKQMIPSEKN
ncbi:MAG: hypothetical protein K8S13_12580 [Desulfobacula sp.]|uniref:hypothetical protein n=1 Tax=Desulfobacula sp. TaxID=2593537 RepID=UPI0025C37F9F|nr:hypothetical protein [Desulfobacula sp.]MCD4720674.1 hypothetical protein [Desulfobacula sp.]